WGTMPVTARLDMPFAKPQANARRSLAVSRIEQTTDGQPMLDRLRNCWLPRCLFTGTLIIAALLIAAIVLCPWLPESLPLLPLFATDVTVRRTALASAAALVVTAFVFFRPSRPKKPSPNEPPPGNMAGA